MNEPVYVGIIKEIEPILLADVFLSDEHFLMMLKILFFSLFQGKCFLLLQLDLIMIDIAIIV